MTTPSTHARGEALVRKWAQRFGLGEFRLVVSPLSETNTQAWALSYYDVEEMWGVVELPPDDSLPGALLELLVLHELAHGLLDLAKSGETGTEQSCNRIARLARADWETRLANEEQAHRIGDAWFDEDDNAKSAYLLGGPRAARAQTDRREWLTLVADALPSEEREVINLLYWEGKSLRDAAEVLGVAHTTVEDRRNKALARLGRYFEALERREWYGARRVTEPKAHLSRRIIALREPEGGAEHEVVYLLHHRCAVANALIRTEVGDEDMDLLVFPVGNAGYGMPKGIPFAVQALDACRACGQDVGCYFVWQAGNTNHPGEIWTPS